MNLKSDSAAEIGKHAFEVAGLGIGPFMVVGFSESVYQAHPDAPRQPGTCCDFCGTGIMTVCHISPAKGKIFKVGINCVEKTGDAGLIKAYKQRPEYRAMLREKAAKKDERVKTEWAALIADESACKILSGYMGENNGFGYHKIDWFTFASRAWGYCGASGRAGYLAAAKKILKAQVATA